jgi:hypothetical protein
MLIDNEHSCLCLSDPFIARHIAVACPYLPAFWITSRLVNVALKILFLDLI